MGQMRDSDRTTMQLGQTGIQVPRLGMGVMVWGDLSTARPWNPTRHAYGPTSSEAEQREALEVGLAAGVNLLDTAEAYGNGASERRVGDLARDRDVFVATKFSRAFTLAGSLPKSLDQSLARLRRDTIDLYQIHFPVPWHPVPTLMNHLADAVEAGKVRAVGVSNYSATQVRTAHRALARRGIPLASNQVEYSLLHRQPETNGLLDTCRELGVTLIAYMPLAAGALTGTYSAANRPAGFRRHMGPFRAKNLQALTPVLGLLDEIAQRHGATPSQVALRWLIQQENVLPIPGAKNARQAMSNAGALRIALTDAEVAALSEATLAWRD